MIEAHERPRTHTRCRPVGRNREVELEDLLDRRLAAVIAQIDGDPSTATGPQGGARQRGAAGRDLALELRRDLLTQPVCKHYRDRRRCRLHQPDLVLFDHRADQGTTGSQYIAEDLALLDVAVLEVMRIDRDEAPAGRAEYRQGSDSLPYLVELGLDCTDVVFDHCGADTAALPLCLAFDAQLLKPRLESLALGLELVVPEPQHEVTRGDVFA